MQFFEQLVERVEALPDDTADAPPVPVVNETFFPEDEAVGQRVVVNNDTTLDVLGVVGDVVVGGLGAGRSPVMYAPYRQRRGTTTRLAARTATEPPSRAPRVDSLVALDAE